MGKKAVESLVSGQVAPGFEKVKEEFINNFKKRKELGAACAAYYRGEKVVDLWGGYRDARSKDYWKENTLVPVFSTTKGIAGMACALAHSRGYFSYDEKVAAYWPEFAQKGKENITVRQLLSHQAGLCVIDEPLDLEILGDPDRLAEVIAAQKPVWEPGTRHGYHGISLGWYESELIRRTDPEGRTLGQFLKEEICDPLGLEMYIGLPDDVPDSRIANIHAPAYNLRMLFNLGKMPKSLIKAMMKKDSISKRTFSNPAILGAPENYNLRELRKIEIPAANGIVQVRDVASLYGVFANGGSELDIKPETMEEIVSPAEDPLEGRFDQVLQLNSRYSLGFLKPFPELQFGTSDKAFGTMGVGGSFAYADPDTQVGFAYAMNRADYYIFADPRETSLSRALFECIEKL